MAAAIPLQLLAPRSASPLRDRLQRPLRDLRVSLTGRCNFRCPYCMPTDAAPRGRGPAPLDAAALQRLVAGFVTLGVRKVRLTGGEPLLRPDLPSIVESLARLPGVQDLALTTNGSLLARHAAALHAAGLHRITVSLDTLDAARFAALSGGRGRVADVLAGIEAAERAGFGPLKINCVVQRGRNEDDVLALAAHFRGSGHVLRFIEFMDVGTCNRWSGDAVVPSAELRARIAARWPLRALPPRMRGEVAERHAYVDGGGEVGFVSSVSQPFCGDCNRARLSADGHLYTCLFASRGHDLRPLLAQDGRGLSEGIAAVWQQRADRYSELRATTAGARRVEMYEIGG